MKALRKCLMSAAIAALLGGSAVNAGTTATDQAASQQPAAAATADLSQAPSVYYLQTAAPSGPTPLTPIMFALNGTSFGQWMQNNKINITGFAEAGYFLDTNNPRMGTNINPGGGAPPIVGNGDYPTDIGFPGIYSNRGQLDQVDIMIQKTLDNTKTWDWGFNIEQGYGTDDAQIHSDGMLDTRGVTGSQLGNGRGPDNQYDIVQANVTARVPLGTGVDVMVGKFVTPFGLETINPTGNAFYTHSYLFTYGIPLTQTGVTGTYTLSKLVNGNDWTIMAGVTRGWNESIRDNNGDPDFLAQVAGNLDSAGKWGLVMNFSEGPEAGANGGASQNGGTLHGARSDNSDWWTVVEAIPSWQISDQLKLSVDTLWGDFPHGSNTQTGAQENAFHGNPGIDDGKSAEWYAVAPYLSYKWNSYVTWNLRGEWYRDQGGATVGTSGSYSNTGPLGNTQVSANYYEATLNAQIHPFPTNDWLQWLQIRPEVRYDYSSRPTYNAVHSSSVGGAGDYSEFTFAIDAIMQF